MEIKLHWCLLTLVIAAFPLNFGDAEFEDRVAIFIFL
jgi:hypothetical protein